MAITTGMDTATTSKQPTIMELAGVVMDLSSNLDGQLLEFLEGVCAESPENKPQPVLTKLNGIKERLEQAICHLERAQKLFNDLTNKIA